jgi:Carboxypeptidase regulatory-like domain/TonB dependent receptor
MKRSAWISVAGFCLLCSLWVPSALGQAVYGSILGTVTDPTGAAVNGAKVTVTSETKNVSTETTTNESGNYSVTHLIPDVYAVRVEGTGFKTLEFKDIQVSADTGAKVDGQFQVGSASEQVEVTAQAEQLKTDRADVSVEFNARAVEDLPILNRNFTSFELLSPGTQKLVGWSHAATENPQGGQQIFVNGQTFSGTAFELDGTDNQDPILGIIVVNPNLDAIQETKVTLGNFDAEFGKAIAGVVTVQTKSGSNDIHGSGFWFRRTDATAARDPFTQFAPDPVTGRLIPSARWQQYGATLGGPIVKNKLFYFADFQLTRQENGVSNDETIPTALLESTCVAGGTNCDFSSYASNIGNGTAGDPSNFLYDPATGTSSGAGRSAFCGSHPEFVPFGPATAGYLAKNQAACATPFQIPVSRMSAASLNMLAAFPSPTNGNSTTNFVGAGSGPYNQNSFDTRFDYATSPTINVFGRFSLNYFALSGAPSLGAVGGIGYGPGGLAGKSNVHNYSLATGVTKTFSSTLLGDFRFGYFQYNPLTAKPDVGVAAMTNFGIPNANQTGSQALETSGLGEFDLDGTGSNFGDGLGVARCNCPLVERERSFQWVGNMTKIHGNHQFKFGADFRYARNLRVPSDSNRAGVYAFSHLNTSGGVQDGSNNGADASGLGGLDFATYMLGDVTQLSRYVATSLTAAERQHRMFYYGQDTWRVTPKFTLNYGVRWEVYFPEYVNGKDQGGFANIVQGVIRVAGEDGIGLNGNIDNKWSYFAPRIGLAYQLNTKTVVRMGYGRSYDMGVFGSNFGHAVTQNLPVLAAQLVQGSTSNYDTAFKLDSGPPAFPFPTTFPGGVLPLAGPQCFQTSSVVIGGVTEGQSCAQPHIRPTFQRLPSLDSWNATVQRQVTSSTSLEVAYIGNHGSHGFAGDGNTYNVNGPSIVGYAAGVPQVQRRPYYNAFTYSGYPDPSSTTGSLMCCSTDQGNYLGNDASSIYNALQVKVDKRFNHGLQFLTHYTYARADRYDSNYYNISHAISWGPSDQVRHNVWATSTVYELPFGKGKSFAGNAGRAEDLIIGGWQIAGISNWSSGLPWTPSFAECGGEEDVGICRPDKGTGSFKRGSGSLQHPAGASPYVQFFTPVANITTTTGGPFADPGFGNLGNYGVNSLIGPRGFWADATLMKNFSITERVKAQFRMDAFNVFNHPVLGFNANQGNLCIDCGGNAGQVTDIEEDSSPGSTSGMRQLEFALKFSF